MTVKISKKLKKVYKEDYNNTAIENIKRLEDYFLNNKLKKKIIQTNYKVLLRTYIVE